jgi:type 1 fimbria pilin
MSVLGFTSKLSMALFAFSVVTMGAAHAFSETTKHDVSLTGIAESNPCKVDLPSTVELGDIDPNSGHLPYSNSNTPDSSTAQMYTIEISGCEAGQMAQVSVLGTPDEMDSTVLKNTAKTDAATNIAVAFWDNNGKNVVKLPINTGTTDKKNMGTTSRFIFQLGPVRTTSAAPTAGNVAVDAQVKIDYL